MHQLSKLSLNITIHSKGHPSKSRYNDNDNDNQSYFRGSAIALTITYYLVFVMFIAYIWGSGIYTETWPGNYFYGINDILIHKKTF